MKKISSLFLLPIAISLLSSAWIGCGGSTGGPGPDPVPGPDTSKDPGTFWTKEFGDGGDTHNLVKSVSVDPAGNIVVAGDFESANFGTGPIATAGGSDVVVAKFDLTGNLIWNKAFGSSGHQYAGASPIDFSEAMALDKQGNIFVTGSFANEINFGGTTFKAEFSNNEYDIYLAKLNTDGNHVWSKAFIAAGKQESRGIAVDSNGDVILAGSFIEPIDLGNGPIASLTGYEQLFVAKFSGANGNLVWVKTFAGTNTQTVDAIAVDHANDIVVSGSFDGEISFGGQAINDPSIHDGMYLVKLDTNGNHVWTKGFQDGGLGSDSLYSISFDSNKNIILGAVIAHTTNFGGDPIEITSPLSGGKVVVVKFSPNGDHLWSKGYEGNFGNYAQVSTAVSKNGEIFVTTSFYKNADFGQGPISGDEYDSALLKFDASGNLVTVKPFVANGDQWINDLALDGSGHPIFGGVTSLNFSAGYTRGFLTHFVE